MTRLAIHHNGLINSRQPIDRVIDAPQTEKKTRDKLIKVKSILAYAKKEGLNVDDAYRYYVETKEPVVSYLVQAAFADRLESKKWWFPIVGSVPYLGFFSKEERDAKAKELQDHGYDVYRTGVGAFSSLGWFDDPIYTSMLQRSDSSLAHLLFHELTHRTVWIAGSTKFNENLAEYVGTFLTRKFLSERGELSQLSHYEKKRDDKKLFKAWLKRLRDALERLYDKPPSGGREVLLAKKADLFKRFTTAPEKPSFATVDFIGDRTWNNASVLSASLYSPDTTRFAAGHRCIGFSSIGGFLSALEEAVDDAEDEFQGLDNLCLTAKATSQTG